ncbi:hypothetical protein ABZW32_15455 [Streptomyces sp. NPDC004667]|uniref:hypothetical protein n=1 Tax=Streptomyces sp. NPDC004667 TaxID=3154285 RepID=UPI0033B24991
MQYGPADRRRDAGRRSSGPGRAIGDGSCLNADKILAEGKIEPKSGNGRMVLAECAGAPELVEAFSRANWKV